MVTLKCNSDHIKTMKKLPYIFFALAAIITASCSKHNTDGPQPLNSYIFFDAGMSDIVETKTERIPDDVFQNDGTAFGVLGFYQYNAPIFNGYTNKIARVYREGGLYKYNNLAVWQGTSHRFSAFYPYDELLSSVKVGTDNIPYIEYTQPWDKSYMKDIVGAYTEVENANPVSVNEPVELHFNHLLWAFYVVIKNSQTLEVTADEKIENPSLIIKKITLSLGDFPKNANLKLDQNFSVIPGSAVPEPESVILYSEETGEQVVSGEIGKFGPLLFIPVTSLTYKITVDYTTQSGFSDTFSYPASGYISVSSTFSKGQVYNLVIEKTNDKFFVGNINNDGNWDDWNQNVNHEFE